MVDVEESGEAILMFQFQPVNNPFEGFKWILNIQPGKLQSLIYIVFFTLVAVYIGVIVLEYMLGGGGERRGRRRR